MQTLIVKCDRCRVEADHLPGDVRIHLGGKTFGSKLFFDLCEECLDEIRVWLHTPPGESLSPYNPPATGTISLDQLRQGEQ